VTERKPDLWQAAMLPAGAEPGQIIPAGYETAGAPWEPVAAAGLPPLILWRRPLYRKQPK
jgi:hypothetical protein